MINDDSTSLQYHLELFKQIKIVASSWSRYDTTALLNKHELSELLGKILNNLDQLDVNDLTRFLDSALYISNNTDFHPYIIYKLNFELCSKLEKFIDKDLSPEQLVVITHSMIEFKIYSKILWEKIFTLYEEANFELFQKLLIPFVKNLNYRKPAQRPEIYLTKILFIKKFSFILKVDPNIQAYVLYHFFTLSCHLRFESLNRNWTSLIVNRLLDSLNNNLNSLESTNVWRIILAFEIIPDNYKQVLIKNLFVRFENTIKQYPEVLDTHFLLGFVHQYGTRQRNNNIIPRKLISLIIEELNQRVINQKLESNEIRSLIFGLNKLDFDLTNFHKNLVKLIVKRRSLEGIELNYLFSRGIDISKILGKFFLIRKIYS